MRNVPKLVRIWIASLLLAGCVWSQTFVAKPLNDLGKEQYKGFAGGLYENGSNDVPADHHAVGLALAEQVKPIRRKFVFLAVGMSNTAMEFFTFSESRIWRQPRESQFHGSSSRRRRLDDSLCMVECEGNAAGARL